MRPALPIDPFLPALCASLARTPSLVLVAEPGAGKTTRFPSALLDSGVSEVIVLEPRRLAARLAARRVAEERGERPGETVGWQVRFEEVAGPRTRLRFVTEGVLVRRLISDPTLRGVGAVILDEFHERHLEGDLCLALLRRLRRSKRPDLKIAVMSATLDPAPIAAFLGGAPVFDVPGRNFDVAIEHVTPGDRPLEQEVASAVRRLAGEEAEGDILVFLPGAAEIRRAREALEPAAASKGWMLAPLHGDLPPAEQDRAVTPGRRGERKIVLSTNVAETSVTLEGVVGVVDTGLARVAGHSAWSGLPTLKTAKVSRASATQRAGRAGRVRSGRCLRLYTRHDFESRPEREPPEIERLDLAGTMLTLHGLGLDGFEWLDPPHGSAQDAAEALLARLGAVDVGGRLTPLGRKMSTLPMHPRQARLMLEAEARGHGEAGAALAALMGEKEIRLDARARFGDRRHGTATGGSSGPSDLLEALELFEEAERRGFEAGALRMLGLDAGATHAVARVKRSLMRRVPRAPSEPGAARDEALLVATLAAFPDRVGRRRGATLVLSGGGSARIAESSVVRDAPFAVVVDVEERGLGGGREALVRGASQVEPLWLLELFPDRVTEEKGPVWNGDAERVEWRSRLCYDDLVLEEGRIPEADPTATAALLFDQAKGRGVRAFCDGDAFDQLVERVRFVRQFAPEAGFEPLEGEPLDRVLREACEGLRGFEELRDSGLLARLLTPERRALLDRLAPDALRLPGGRRARIEYAEGRPPSLASRMQDFFGMADGPKLANGRCPLVLHLLAPNQRAVQVTTDLAGFWARHWPAIRKELCRRYPRHAWPENPLTAAPPQVKPR